MCFHDGALHPIVVRVYYTVPACEMVGMDFLPPEGFNELRVAEYAKQAIGQQAITDYMAFADKQAAVLKRSVKLEDPFFEE